MTRRSALALLRGFIEESDEPAATKPKRKPAPPVLVRPIAVPVAPPADLTVRPDLAGFAQEVRRHAVSRAQGWPGDRKAYISHVWRHIRDKRPDWGLSEIEFKCMLAEAHRAGQPGARQRRPQGQRATSRTCRTPPSPTRTPCSISSASTADAAARRTRSG